MFFDGLSAFEKGAVFCAMDSANEKSEMRPSVKLMLKYYKNVHFDKEGFLYVTGRKKNVIVTKNGKNIFPEEVEYYLNKSDYIAEVMVYGLEEENGETVVCADIFPDFAMIEAHFGETSL